MAVNVDSLLCMFWHKHADLKVGMMDRAVKTKNMYFIIRNYFDWTEGKN